MASDGPRVLVLGATGMLGHRLWAHCAERFETRGTVRGDAIPQAAVGVLDPERTITGVEVGDDEALDGALSRARADAVVNCIGVVKQLADDADAVSLVAVNSLFPHQVEAASERHGARLIQVSTDCVFSGDRGGYTEEDRPDPIDFYGRSKLAGEPRGARTLTLRTSMIGRELGSATGVLEWFLTQRGTVPGFSQARFSGPTTPVLCRLIGDLIERGPELTGVWHVGAAPISKLELLQLVRDSFELDTVIEPDSEVRIDRSLDSSRLREATGWHPPDWREMISELAEEGSDNAH